MKEKIIKTAKITHKVLYVKLAIIVFALLPVVVFTLLTSKTNLIANIRSFVVLTGSMSPTISQGSLIYVQKTAQYNSGDIISFENVAKQTVTHRIASVVKKDNKVFYQTKGDANNSTDSTLVEASAVIGKSVFFVPYVGNGITFLKTPLGFTGLIIFPITVFIVFELWNLKKEIEKEVEKRLRKKMETVAA